MESSGTSVFIVDDEAHARSNLQLLITTHCPLADLAGSAESVQSALVLIEKSKPDIVFLDVQLQDGTGFDLLDRISKIDFHVIFTTAYDEFAIKAFRYNAIDYLLKPINPDDLVTAFNKAKNQTVTEHVEKQISGLIQSTSKNNFDRIVLPTSDGMIFTHTRDIIRLESYGNYSFVYLANGDRILTAQNLKLFEEILPETVFFRIHQSFIINTLFLKKIINEDGDFAQMSDTSKVPISRRRKEEFIKMLKG